jgi:hypothetical protein
MQHLAECAECTRVYDDFCRLSAYDLGMLAVQKRSEVVSNLVGGPLDEDVLLARLMGRTESERGNACCRPQADAHARVSLRQAASLRVLGLMGQPRLRSAAVVVLVCAVVGVGTYRLRDRQLLPALQNLRSQVDAWRAQAKASAFEKEQSALELAKRNKLEREAATRALQGISTRNEKLQSQLSETISLLIAARHAASDRAHELEALQATLADKSRELAELQGKLHDTVRALEEQREVAEGLKRSMALNEPGFNAMVEQGALNDTEAKDLFGARDLHIIDVYDVDGKGQTKRTYGRVYYVEKKFLIFYAFDLDNKERDRAPAGFQAWGYSQPNEGKPENLGLFAVDDAAMNRWVLAVNNPRVLQHIDAVFVTLESPRGSSSPRGRRLLYANLAVPPNHP